MPDIKITQVLSFSSEDANFPASNLLGSESYRKWKTKTAGEKEASVMLKFENSARIEAIHIGNECSAFVEVYVGKLGADVKDFKVLLPTSSFMSPAECRAGSNTGRVRLFERDRLTEAAAEPWEVARVVCTQPFCRTAAFGLAFVRFRAKSAPMATSARVAGTGAGESLKLGAFTLLPESKAESIRAGGLFNRRAELSTGGSVSSDRVVPPRLPAAAAVDEPAPPKPTSYYQLKPETKQRPASKPAPKPESKPAAKPESKPAAKPESKLGMKQGQKQEKLEMKPASKPAPATASTSEIRSVKVSPTSPILPIATAPVASGNGDGASKNGAAGGDDTPPSNAIFRPLGKLLSGVVFAMSGYKNPERAELRDKGVKLGAKYRPDWGSDCTHLICAFRNTPKYAQVAGRGKIVTGDWLTACARRKRRINWRVYALDTAEARRPASDDEVWAEELRPPPPPGAPPAPPTEDDEYGGSTDEMDTDDEIRMAEASMKPSRNASGDAPASKQKPSLSTSSPSASPVPQPRNPPLPPVSAPQKRSSSPSTAATPSKRAASANGSTSGLGGEDSDAAYDADTDEDEPEGRPDTSGLPVPALPEFLRGRTFLLYGEAMSAETRRRATRYITAFGGKLEQYFGNDVNCVITADAWDDNFDEALSDNPELMFARPAWLDACARRGKLVPPQAYLVTALV